MKSIRFDYSKAQNAISVDEMASMAQAVKDAHEKVHNKTGVGHEFLGWLDLPNNYDKEEFCRICKTAETIRNKADVFIVIGVGGSYLGACAAIDMLANHFYNLQDSSKRKAPQIFFAGNSVNSTYLYDLCEFIRDKSVCVNVISKSGTTTEPAIAFRILKKYMEDTYGKAEAKNRIFVTTDKERGALKAMADKEGYETFVIADDIGGRYSVLSAVGLLPIAVSGVDIEDMMQGAQVACREYETMALADNPCYQYAAARNLLYQKGKTLEILVNYEPRMKHFAEWWKQLYGESEGKDRKGIFPAAMNFSTDLHSMGQYVQDGLRNLFETVLHVETAAGDLVIPRDEEDIDGLNYLADKTVAYVNEQAFRGATQAHFDGEVPNLIIHIPEISAYYFGQLVYFFEKACSISGYILGVNPFDQPGVEAYKRNMFAFLGKPGYEKEQEALQARL